MADTTVAKTILEQLGGNRFIVMTGAKTFIEDGNALEFRLPRTPHFVAKGINFVRVQLEPTDLYTVTFSKVHKLKLTEVSKHEMVYAEDLESLFRSETGLATHL